MSVLTWLIATAIISMMVQWFSSGPWQWFSCIKQCEEKDEKLAQLSFAVKETLRLLTERTDWSDGLGSL